MEERNLLSPVQMIQPIFNCNDGSRLTMVSAHLNQLIPLINSENPTVFSVYNSTVANLCTDTYKAKEKGKVIGKFNLFNNTYLLIHYVENNWLDVINIDDNINEGFQSISYIFDGEEFEAGEELFNYNEVKNNNINIGINANVCYSVFNENFEDAFIISESFAEKTSHLESEIISFYVNTNEYLLDIYDGKPLPSIGEEIDSKSRILAVKRVINKKFLNSIIGEEHINFEDDDIFYSKGIVENIMVIKNDEDNNTETSYYRSLNELERRTKLHLLNFVAKITQLKEEKDCKFSKDLTHLYKRSQEYLNRNNTFINENGTKFKGFYVEIKISRKVKTTLGSKITSFHASKGLVTKILPDEEMPTTEDGVVADIIFNPNSVIGRQNLGQINEVILNNLADVTLKAIKKTGDISLYIELMKMSLGNSSPYFKLIKNLLREKEDEYRDYLINTAKYIEIPIEPLKNPDFGAIREYVSQLNKFIEENNLDLVYENEKKILLNGKLVKNKLLFGRLYIIKLKHEAEKKMSYASANRFSEITSKPIKDSRKKKYKAPNNHAASVLGEMELTALLLDKEKHILKELIYVKSSNKKPLENFMYNQLCEKQVPSLELLLEGDLEHDGVKAVKEYFKVLGLSFN